MAYAQPSVPAVLLGGLMLSGCSFVPPLSEGGVAATEVTDEGDHFDPLEDTEVGREIYD